jgi:hypothetical protein
LVIKPPTISGPSAYSLKNPQGAYKVVVSPWGSYATWQVIDPNGQTQQYAAFLANPGTTDPEVFYVFPDKPGTYRAIYTCWYYGTKRPLEVDTIVS